MKINATLTTLIVLIIFATQSFSQNVFTQHNNNSRTGWNNNEKKLNISNVTAGSFGKLFTLAVDDQIYAQPLTINHVTISGKGKRNVVYVATVNNSVYAFDADSSNNGTPYWQINLTLPHGRAPKNTDMTGACGGGYRDFSGNMGIVGTPVIDTATNTMYLVARTIDSTSSHFYQYLHAIDITTGKEKTNSPVLITAHVNGTGDGSINGVISFDPQRNNQRPALLLLNGTVYIGWSSHCDWRPYHGWVMGYDETTLKEKRIYNTTPAGYEGGIWMSGEGLSADSLGNIYLGVGNGSVGVSNNPSDLTNRSESALKLTPTDTSFTIASFFSPNNISELEASDLDFGVTQMLLIPNTNDVIVGCKDGHLYLMNKDTLGGYDGNTNHVKQSIDLGTNASLRSSLTYYNGATNAYVYSWSENTLLKQFAVVKNADTLNTGNVTQSGVQGPVGNNGAQLAVSSNGSDDNTAILWAYFAANGDANQSVRPGILHAFAASNVTHELWNSSMVSTDNPGNYAKFNPPTICNGKVYLPTFSNQLVVYGLTGKVVDTCNTPNIALNKTATASSSKNNFPVSNAFDGNATTFWKSNAADTQFVNVDLGTSFNICQVVLKWNKEIGKNFKIQLSNDTLQWKNISTVKNNSSITNTIDVKGSGRYVRLYLTVPSNKNGYSLSEFEVYGNQSGTNCTQPTSLSVSDVYENTAVLHWQSTGTGNYNVQYKAVTSGDWITISADTNFVALKGLACGSDYLYRVQGVCSSTSVSNYSVQSAFSTLSCNANCGPLPTRWSTADIGNVGIAGSACYSDSVYTLQGSGDDIWNNADAFRFAYKTLVGDETITARVTSIDNTDVWNKIGIMIREDLTAGSRNAFIAFTSGNGITYQYRNTPDGSSSNSATGSSLSTPYWIRLVKAGSLYSGFYSKNGNNWTALGSSINVGFGDSTAVYAGFAITSHNDNELSTGTIDNYSLSGASSLQLLSFTADLTTNQTVSIQWISNIEVGLKKFILQRSIDDVNFATIDSADAENDGEYTVTYNKTDLHPAQGLNYYRLQILNDDGTYNYSPLATVFFTNSIAPVIYPNPAKYSINIAQGTDQIKMINIYDITGRVMINNSLQSGATNPVIISTANLASGIYFVEIRTTTSVYRNKIFVKQ